MTSPAGPHLDRLAAVFERLRAPGGCPWDRDRSLTDLGRYLREECDEVVAALAAAEKGGDTGAFREECGDLLANLVFTVEIAREKGWFDIESVTRGACEKIVRRHPHVFGDATATTSAEVEVLWKRIKEEERAGATMAAKPGSAATRNPKAGAAARRKRKPGAPVKSPGRGGRR